MHALEKTKKQIRIKLRKRQELHRVTKILAVAIIMIIASVVTFLAQNYIIPEEYTVPPSLGYLILAAVAVILLFFSLFLSSKRERRMNRMHAETWKGILLDETR